MTLWSRLLSVPCLSCAEAALPRGIFCEHCAQDFQRQLLPRLHFESLGCFRLQSATTYEGTAAQLARIAKSQPYGALSEELQVYLHTLIDFWKSEMHSFAPQAVVAVPSHPVRAFFQTDLSYFLAEAWGKKLGIPVWTQLVRRAFVNPLRGPSLQKNRDRGQRRARALGQHFYLDAVTWRAWQIQSYQRVLLVDDICTTGSSLQACAALLRESVRPPAVRAWVMSRSFLRQINA